MGLFGRSFEEKVHDAVKKVAATGIAVRDLRAEISGKVVTLRGQAADIDAKTRAMVEFNKLVETGNTVNQIGVDRKPADAPAVPAAAPPAPAPAAERTHEVVAGDTLSGIAAKYYGKGSLYMKIFEANRDVLSDPDRIHPGQRLRIPD